MSAYRACKAIELQRKNAIRADSSKEHRYLLEVHMVSGKTFKGAAIYDGGDSYLQLVISEDEVIHLSYDKIEGVIPKWL